MKRILCSLYGVISLALFVSTGFTATLKSNLTHYQLENGLNIWVKSDKRSPIAVVSLWYQVGGAYEEDGLTGISHVLEHMMFQGTHKIGPGGLVKRVTDMGGIFNAVTTADYTQYYETIPKEHLPQILALEADRMHNLNLQKTRYDKEIQVVKEEWRMRTRDNPFGLAFERFMALSFVNNPYHHPVIGWKTDLDHMTIKDVSRWYKTWYVPNNALLIVVGDVDPEKIHHLANKYFGAIKKRAVPQLKPRTEIPFLGYKSIDVQVEAKSPVLMMGYHVPSLATIKADRADAWKVYALVVASAILGGDDSSRLVNQLVRKQHTATAISTDYDPLTLHEGLFSIFAYPDPNCSLRQLKVRIEKSLNDMSTAKVSDHELSRIKARVIANQVYQKDSMMAEALQLGSYGVVGLPVSESEDFARHVQEVTADQVKQVVQDYLTGENLSVAYVHAQQGKNP